jgi:uncharacterized membrane protein
MSFSTKLLVWSVIAFHAAIFLVEVFFWMQPGVYGIALQRLADPVGVDPHTQALILKATFINLGFYNLFLAAAGVAGLTLTSRGEVAIGRTLILYMCLSAVGAGIVLLFSTSAYVGALLQALPAAAALGLMVRADPIRNQSGAT